MTKCPSCNNELTPSLVFIIGDSISIGYTPHVAKALGRRARVRRHEGNAGDSRNVLSNLSAWLGELGEKPDLIHVNAGLHDLRFWVEKNEYQVPLEAYRKNIRILAGRLAATGAKPVWATTTPVLDGAPQMSPDFPRSNADVEAYNAAALEGVEEAGLAVDDLNACVKRLGPERIIRPDGVHFTEDGYAELGRQAAEAILDNLS